jgi:hypothetical protein
MSYCYHLAPKASPKAHPINMIKLKCRNTYHIARNTKIQRIFQTMNHSKLNIKHLTLEQF